MLQVLLYMSTMHLLPNPGPPSLDSFPMTRCFALLVLEGVWFFVNLFSCVLRFAWIT